MTGSTIIKRGNVYTRNGRSFPKKYTDADMMTKGTVVPVVIGKVRGVDAVQFRTELDLETDGGSHSLPAGVATERYFKKIES